MSVNPISADPEFLADYAKVLGCKAEVFEMACVLINKYKNFQTACAIMFGLSFRDNRDYLVKCAEHLQSVLVPGTVATSQWLVQFRDYYMSEVEKYPE